MEVGCQCMERLPGSSTSHSSKNTHTVSFDVYKHNKSCLTSDAGKVASSVKNGLIPVHFRSLPVTSSSLPVFGNTLRLLVTSL